MAVTISHIGTVDAFNNLIRSKLLPMQPNTLPIDVATNHWDFCVRHIPLGFESPGDYLQIVQHDLYFDHCEPPTQILSLPTLAAQAEVIVPMLLGAFVRGMLTEGWHPDVPALPPFAPWSWSTNDAALARCIEVRLRELGVRPELCTVQPATYDENGVEDCL
jgi:hypothetical protein